jgi:aminopeptidase
VRDQRADALARVLVQHSVQVKAGEVCVIQSFTNAEPLVQAVYEEVLRAGGLPIMQLSTEGAAAAFFELASDEQLDWIPPTAEWSMENADCRIAIMADANTRALTQADPARLARAQLARKRLLDVSMRRSEEGTLRWVGTLFPTHAYAADAGMSLEAFERFYYGACLADRPDPVAAWREQAEGVQRLAAWMEGREEVRITGPGTDLRLGIAGRRFIPCAGERNMPDGEFFTGPIEDSVEGEVAFSFPAAYGGREVGGVRFRFEGGRIVDASAERGEELLLQTLDTDDGARRLGELGIGTNYAISTGTKQILLDEKIGGTVHLAIGKGYPETGSTNDSAVHWDMVLDLRQGGRIEVDGVELQRDGEFVVDLAGVEPRPRR